MYVDVCRNSEIILPTNNKVVVLWDLMYDKKAMFARDLTEDKEIHKDSAYRVCKLSRELKQAIPNIPREMMILKTMWLNQGLDAECVKRAV